MAKKVVVVNDNLIIGDCDYCPYGESGMFVWCYKKNASHTLGGIPKDCPLPNAEENK